MWRHGYDFFFLWGGVPLPKNGSIPCVRLAKGLEKTCNDRGNDRTEPTGTKQAEHKAKSPGV